MNHQWKIYLEQEGAHIETDAVAYFTSIADEAQQATTGNILVDLSYFGLIKVSGKNPEDFLQGQFTCDVREVDQNQSRLGAYCNPKGRILASFRLFKYHDNYFLYLPISILNKTLNQLKKYAVFSKTMLEDVSGQLIHIGCSGPQIEDHLKTVCKSIPQTTDQVVVQDDFVIIRNSGKYPRFEIIGTLESVKTIWQSFKSYAQPVGSNAWRLLDINAGIPTIYPETAELFTPHMINYPGLNGVSFKKGCYIGQEIISRTQFLGKAKRHLYHSTISNSDPPKSGEKLTNENQQEVGIVVDAALSSQKEYQLLAVIQDDAIGSNIFCNGIKLEKTFS